MPKSNDLFDEERIYANWVRARDLSEMIEWPDDVKLSIEESEITKRGKIQLTFKLLNFITLNPDIPSTNNPAIMSGLLVGATNFNIRTCDDNDVFGHGGKIILNIDYSWSNLELINKDIPLEVVADRASGMNLPRIDMKNALKLMDKGLAARHVALAYSLDQIPEFRFIKKPIYREGEDYFDVLDNYRDEVGSMLYRIWKSVR